MWQVLNILSVPSTGDQSVAGYSSGNTMQMLQVQSYWKQVLSALDVVLTTCPNTGTWSITCFVHEITVEYCSSVPVPTQVHGMGNQFI